MRHEEPQHITQRIDDCAHAGCIDQRITADGDAGAECVEQPDLRTRAGAMRKADGDHAAADQHDTGDLQQRRMFVQQKDRANRGEQWAGATRHRIDGGKVCALVRLHQQQFVERMHEGGRRQQPDRFP